MFSKPEGLEESRTRVFRQQRMQGDSSTTKQRMKHLTALFTFAVVLLFLLAMSLPVKNDSWRPKPRISPNFTIHNQNKESVTTKMILLYSAIFERLLYDIPKPMQKNLLSTLNCRVSNCVVTYDRELLGKSHIVLFHARGMPHANHLWQLRNKGYPQKQLWGYFIRESPENTPDPAPLHGLFNLTLTYRKDSDVWVPYSKYLPLFEGEDRPDITINYAAKKKPGAAWVVSHCGLVREQYVIKLQEMYPVHVGGGCKGRYMNKLPCNQNDCLQYIKRYKFYIAFENGFCQEYITEKYWRNALKFESVPIVMGAGPYDNEEYGAIPGSYINVKDFTTIRDLANYLHYLDRNDTAYNEYFNWKQKYKPFSKGFPNLLLCPICEFIHRANYSDKTSDLTPFWGRIPSCSFHDDEVKGIIARS